MTKLEINVKIVVFCILYYKGMAMNSTESFTTFDVIKILNIKLERLQDWMKRGYIKPTYQEPLGKRMKSYFDRLQLYSIQTFKYLVENGITRKEAAEWTGEIHQSVRTQFDAAKAAPNQKKENLDYLKQMPTFIIVYKGPSPYGKKGAMLVTKDKEHTISLDSSLKADAIHIINFKKITEAVDKRIE